MTDSYGATLPSVGRPLPHLEREQLDQRPAVASQQSHGEAFEAFVTDQLPSLLGYAIVLTGDRELAADIVQDVMVRVHARWSRVSTTDHPNAYVRRMVTNQYLSWRRRWQVRSVFVAADDVLHTRMDPSPDATGVIDDREDLLERLRGLPSRQRAIIVLRYLEDLSDPDIADLLGMSLGTVRSTASRALHALRAEDAQSANDTPISVVAPLHETLKEIP